MDPTDLDALKIKTIFWQKNMTIPDTPWLITGYSRSAFRTGFYIPALDIMLDAGPQNFNKPTHIFITHTHIDHVACLPFTMIGDVEGDHIFQIYAIAKAQKYLTNYINAMFSVNAMRQVDAQRWFNYCGLNPNDKFRFTSKNTHLEVEVFECDHAIPTISYGFSEIKQKLKEEYLGLQGKEIAKLKKEGVEITKEVVTKRFTYVCDTSIRVFDTNPQILEYPVIFIECTFLEDDELENAEKTQHIHWQQLKPYVQNNPDKIFILFHFSQRYRDTEISAFFQKEVDTGLTNLRWW